MTGALGLAHPASCKCHKYHRTRRRFSARSTDTVDLKNSRFVPGRRSGKRRGEVGSSRVMGTVERPESPSKRNGCNCGIPRLQDAVGSDYRAGPPGSAAPTRCLVLARRANPCLLIKVETPPPPRGPSPSALRRQILADFCRPSDLEKKISKKIPWFSARAPNSRCALSAFPRPPYNN